jgi:hypothetical protein
MGTASCAGKLKIDGSTQGPWVLPKTKSFGPNGQISPLGPNLTGGKGSGTPHRFRSCDAPAGASLGGGDDDSSMPGSLEID